MALLPHQIDDFVNLTLDNFKKVKWTDLSLEHQEYVSAQLITDKNVVEAGGPYVNFKLKTRNTGNARKTGLYAQDITNVEDVTISAQVPWAMQTTNFSYDINEDLFQSDRETIIREMVIRDHDAMSDMAELIEECFWSAPTGTSDAQTPMGVPFWLQKDATTTPGGGFNGGNPSGFTSGCAGVSSTTYPRWRNWTFGYTNVTTDDMVTKVKKSLAFTNFQAPVPHPELGFGGKTDYAIYTTYRVTEPLERLAESRNDNLGSDVARYVNAVTIGGVPVKWVPYLEANDTSDPLYGINWKVFRPFTKKGLSMRRNPPKQAARQHTVREVHIDNALNFICLNRRMTFVGSKS
jgi:hypothetical protein